MGTLLGPLDQISWRPIPGTGLEGALYRGLIWLRGPCGQQHTLSPEAAREVASWLWDVTAPTIDGEAVDLTRHRTLGPC